MPSDQNDTSSNSTIFKAACFVRGRLPTPPLTLPFALMIGTLVAI